MKVLSKSAICTIDTCTNYAIKVIGEKIEEGTSGRITAIDGLNVVRSKCGLEKIVFPSKTASFPFVGLGDIRMPKVKPPKQEEHIHDFMIIHTNEVNATICCRACGEVRHIETTIPMKKPSNKIIKISFEDFEDLCDGAASFRELKELLIERMENE